MAILVASGGVAIPSRLLRLTSSASQRHLCDYFCHTEKLRERKIEVSDIEEAIYEPSPEEWKTRR